MKQFLLLYLLLFPIGIPTFLPALFQFSGPDLNSFNPLFPFIAEICDNGIDDDGDGFIDLFDTDCPCSEDAFQAFCPIQCETLPDSFPNIQLKLKWQSAVIVNQDHLYPNIVVGDLNQDGVVDIVTKRSIAAGNNVTNGIIAFNGTNGQKTVDYNSIPRNVDAENYFISIADVDNDGISEFFYSRQDTIVCVNFDGTVRWKSDRLNEEGGYCVNLADFNGDGIPEVYKGNNIVNARTGKLLVNSNGSGGCNRYGQFGDCGISHTIAADLLPSAGLELAAGNTVYEVNITNTNGSTGNSMTPVNANSPVRDGMTSVGDIDGDGELDVVVIRSNDFNDNGGIWVWNPRTRKVIASSPAGNVGGVAFIGNVAGDCRPEIGVNFENRLRMLTYDGTTTLHVLYNLTTTDGSGYTGVTMFDFNQDGFNELIYRDETFLRIMEGSTGATLTSYRVNNGTGMEYPVVADVDGDGEAEIIVSGYVSDYSEQRLFCFESGGTPWAPARSVWNQPGYHVTNVNDDLTIPRYQHNQAKSLIGYETCLLPTCPAPYNAFMAQATFRTQQGCVQFPAIDLTIKIIEAECKGDSIMLCYALSNEGDHDLVQKTVGIAIWPSDPLHSSSPPLAKISLFLNLNINQSDTFCVKMSSGNLPDSIFMAVNDPGTVAAPYQFPLTDLPECRYYNNIDSLDLNIQMVLITADTALCEGQTLLFHDSLIIETGHYLISGINCDSLFDLNVVFNEKDSIQFTQSICSGDSVLFNGIWLFSSGNYQSVYPNNRGCDSTSFLHLTVASQIFAYDSLFICKGDSIWIIDKWASSQGSYFTVIPGVSCDTLLESWLQVYPTYYYETVYEACPGDSFFLDNHWITQSEVVTEYFQSVSGCDSIEISDIAMPGPIQAPVFIVNCDSASIEASIEVGGDWSVEWSNGTQGTLTQYHNEGAGEVTLYGGLSCEEKYQFNLPSIPHLNPLQIWVDTSILENHTLKVDLNLDPNEWTVEWTPASIFSCPTCLSTIIQPTTNTSVTANLLHSSGCPYTLSFSITLEEIVHLYIPNVFSPNGDGINDEWIVSSPGDQIEIMKLDIFDRWGNHLYHGANLRKAVWNGRFRDQLLNPGVFAYTITYQDQENKTQTETGNITLAR